jgi:hypothetical protein
MDCCIHTAHLWSGAMVSSDERIGKRHSRKVDSIASVANLGTLKVNISNADLAGNG